MNIFEIMATAAKREAAWKSGVMNELGYKPFTTFFNDYTIAELTSGIRGVKDTFNRASKEWISNYKYFTEMVMVLNHKIWEHYKTDYALAKVYDELWRKAEDMFHKKYEGNEKALDYYYSVLD